MVYDCGYAVANFDGNGLGFDTVLAHTYSHHAGLTVERTGGVEDEIAYAVVYLLAQKLLDRLQCVGVVTNKRIGTGTYQLVGVPSLTVDGFQRVFAAPVQRHDDDGCRVGLAQAMHTIKQRVHRLLTHAGPVGKIRVVFECQSER